MDTISKIKEIIGYNFQVSKLEVIDDSASHKGHANAIDGKQTHFRIVISSPEFKDKSLVQSHRMIYSALTELMGKPIHALEIEVIN